MLIREQHSQIFFIDVYEKRGDHNRKKHGEKGYYLSLGAACGYKHVVYKKALPLLLIKRQSRGYEHEQPDKAQPRGIGLTKAEKSFYALAFSVAMGAGAGVGSGSAAFFAYIFRFKAFDRVEVAAFEQAGGSRDISISCHMLHGELGGGKILAVEVNHKQPAVDHSLAAYVAAFFKLEGALDPIALYDVKRLFGQRDKAVGAKITERVYVIRHKIFNVAGIYRRKRFFRPVGLFKIKAHKFPFEGN